MSRLGPTSNSPLRRILLFLSLRRRGKSARRCSLPGWKLVSCVRLSVSSIDWTRLLRPTMTSSNLKGPPGRWCSPCDHQSQLLYRKEALFMAKRIKTCCDIYIEIQSNCAIGQYVKILPDFFLAAISMSSQDTQVTHLQRVPTKILNSLLLSLHSSFQMHFSVPKCVCLFFLLGSDTTS